MPYLSCPFCARSHYERLALVGVSCPRCSTDDRRVPLFVSSTLPEARAKLTAVAQARDSSGPSVA